MKLSIKAGATSQTLCVFIQDSTSTTGAGKTGLVFNTATITAYYAFPKAASVAITLVTLAAVTSAWSSGGFKEIDATHMPGWYRFDIPDAALAAASGRSVDVHFTGVTGMADLPLEIELTAWDNQDAVHGGLSALPNAAAGANTGLPVVGTQIPNATAGAAGGLPTADATNSVKIQVPNKKNTTLNSFAFVMVDSTGTPKTGLTITAQRAIDGAAFANCANSATELAYGVYLISLAASDLNGNVISLRFAAANAKDTEIVLLLAP